MPAGSADARNWTAAAALFVGQGPNRHLVTAVGSSHDVPLDDPALVQTEITGMFDAL